MSSSSSSSSSIFSSDNRARCKHASICLFAIERDCFDME